MVIYGPDDGPGYVAFLLLSMVYLFCLILILMSLAVCDGRWDKMFFWLIGWMGNYEIWIYWHGLGSVGLDWIPGWMDGLC